jgi:hypothetical protein
MGSGIARGGASHRKGIRTIGLRHPAQSHVRRRSPRDLCVIVHSRSHSGVKEVKCEARPPSSPNGATYARTYSVLDKSAGLFFNITTSGRFIQDAVRCASAWRREKHDHHKSMLVSHRLTGVARCNRFYTGNIRFS